ncbi:MAG: SPOR domain-containing protein [Armatimonadetes bacterium]|nr:SPOR domain-containing protein [Armatimonadota bacterium]
MPFSHRCCLVVLALLPLIGAGLVQAQTGSARYAILIVGDEANKEMVGQEKILIQEMARAIRKLDAQERLPIFSYHFNKDKEKTYCEKRLNILREDLLFVGVVELSDSVPRKVAYRLDRIVNPARAAGDVLARAEELAGPPVAADTPTPDASPDEVATPAPGNGENPRIGGWRIQIGSFTQLKYAEDEVRKAREKGHEARISRTESGGVPLFKVYIGDFTTKQEAEASLEQLKADGFTKPFVVEGEHSAKARNAAGNGSKAGGGD